MVFLATIIVAADLEHTVGTFELDHALPTCSLRAGQERCLPCQAASLFVLSFRMLY